MSPHVTRPLTEEEKAARANLRRNMGNAATYLRQLYPLSPEDRQLIEAAIALRAQKGQLRRRYTDEEQRFLRQAHDTAVAHGQVHAARYLTVRTQNNGESRAIRIHKSIHKCPICLRPHWDAPRTRWGDTPQGFKKECDWMRQTLASMRRAREVRAEAKRRRRRRAEAKREAQ